MMIVDIIISCGPFQYKKNIIPLLVKLLPFFLLVCNGPFNPLSDHSPRISIDRHMKGLGSVVCVLAVFLFRLTRKNTCALWLPLFLQIFHSAFLGFKATRVFTFLRTDVFSFPNPGVILGRKPFIRLEGDNILPTSGDPSVYVFVVRLEANNVFFLLEDARRDAKPDCQNCRLLELSTVFLVGA